MAIQNEKFSLLVSDSSGNPLTGSLVELRKDAMIYTLSEVGNGWYSLNSIPTGKYSVFVDSVDTGETKAVGSSSHDDHETGATPYVTKCCKDRVEINGTKSRISISDAITGSTTSEANAQNPRCPSNIKSYRYSRQFLISHALTPI